MIDYLLDVDLPYRDVVTFEGFVDRVYLDAPSRVVLRNGLGKTVAIENEG
jgi:glucose-6-phosphate 1-epimerase